MYYYGGGYCDIKRITHSWIKCFHLLNNDANKSILGYTEISSGVGFITPSKEYSIRDVYNLNFQLQKYYKQLIGNGAYIAKPKSIIFEKLLDEQERRIYNHREELEKNPGNVMGNNSGYPLPWSYILGEIFHPLVYIRKNDILHNDTIKPSFLNYR